MADSVAELQISYSASFPLPFRVLVLAGLGILGWATNLHGLSLLGIDAPAVLDLRLVDGRAATPLDRLERAGAGPALAHARALYAPVYRLCAAYGAWCGAVWVVFRLATQGRAALVDVFKWLPAMAVLGVLTALASPWDAFRKRERDLFLFSLRRCLFPKADRPVYFSDVVFADVFTSYAKVFGDVWLSACMLLPGGSLLILPKLEGWTRWILPTLMSIPYLVRFRQCITEYSSPTNESRRPLYNAIKYATSFPVIYLSAAQRSVVMLGEVIAGGEAVSDDGEGGNGLFRLWLFCAAINSLYSFWWDVTNDWGLEALKPRTQITGPRRQPIPRPLLLPSLHGKTSMGSSPVESPSQASDFGFTHVQVPAAPPFGLRAQLLLPLPIYPLLVFLNLVLRLTWSVKLSSHLHTEWTEGSLAIFLLEVAELVRRWMWVFVRVEWELVRRSSEARREGGSPAPEEEYELVFADADGRD